MSLNGFIEDNAVVTRVDTVITTDMDDEIIMMSVESGQYIHLDDIATEIWRKLEQPRSFGEIVSHLKSVYDVQHEDCQRDTIELVSKLLDCKVLTLT